MNGSELLYSASQLVAKLQLLQKQCELLGQIMSEHELASASHVSSLNITASEIDERIKSCQRFEQPG